MAAVEQQQKTTPISTLEAPSPPMGATRVARRQDTIERREHLKILLVGKPKSAGKTTFALSGRGTKLILNYDLGMVPEVPGVDPQSVYVVQYPAAQVAVQGEKDGWKRPTNVGSSIIKDAEEVRNAFLQNRPIKLGDVEIPLPRTIIADGLTELQATALDWVLGVNHYTDPEDFDNRFAAWGKRLHYMRTLAHMLIPLPCDVVLTTWEVAEEVASGDGRGRQVSKPTGRYLPDIGGKLDNIMPGKVDAVLRCYAKYLDGGVRYFVQCQPDGQREYVGVRGRYGGAKEVDVTLAAGKPLPFERVFGNGGDK